MHVSSTGLSQGDQWTMPTPTASTQEWLELIRAEYLEIPGLNLTKEQVRRLWGLDSAVCDGLLAALVEAGFLRCNARQLYVRRDLGL